MLLVFNTHTPTVAFSVYHTHFFLLHSNLMCEVFLFGLTVLIGYRFMCLFKTCLLCVSNQFFKIIFIILNCFLKVLKGLFVIFFVTTDCCLVFLWL